MKKEILLSGALANCSGEASSEDLLRFLKDHTEDVEYYKLSPPPGTIMAAALDWQAVLGVTASSLAIAQALWAAYKKFIKPLCDKGNSSAFLLVVIENEKKEFIQYSVGKDEFTEETFISEVSESIEKIRMADNDGELEIKRREVRESEVWKRI